LYGLMSQLRSSRDSRGIALEPIGDFFCPGEGLAIRRKEVGQVVAIKGTWLVAGRGTERDTSVGHRPAEFVAVKSNVGVVVFGESAEAHAETPSSRMAK